MSERLFTLMLVVQTMCCVGIIALFLLMRFGGFDIHILWMTPPLVIAAICTVTIMLAPPPWRVKR